MTDKTKKQKVQKLAGIRGMNDIMPEDAPLWDAAERIISDVLSSYGYGRIRTPIVENTALFRRGLGEVTDIVEKEMYSFTDSLNGENLTLRPEGTAGVVRAAIEHSLVYNGPKRLWYTGQMFRHERPQRGRYRQFHQIGAEALGFDGPDIDAEMILLCRRLWDELGIEGVRLEINSIGDPEERAVHRAELIKYFEGHIDLLDEEARRRLYENPLRILDTKNPAMQELADNAPKLLGYLGEASMKHFDGLRRMLDRNALAYTVNPRLVRGMDYYNRTVFEWIGSQLGSQGTICGGGRYDYLFELLGGRHTNAIGFAMGFERVIEMMKESQGITAEPNTPMVYVMAQGDEGTLRASALSEQLRDAGIETVMHCSGAGSSFKTMMKRADESGAFLAVILGEDEVASNEASVKRLRDSSFDGEQTRVSMDNVVDELINVIMERWGVEDGCGCACGCCAEEDPTVKH